jgi:hypothetical protein
MLALSLISLFIAILAVGISLRVTEEIELVAATIVALICLFCSLVCAPWLVKLLIVLAILASEKWLSGILGRYISSSAE